MGAQLRAQLARRGRTAGVLAWALAAALLTAAPAAADAEAPPAPLLRAGWCGPHRVTGYVRSEYGPYTYDKTPIWTEEPIVAASWDIPIDSRVEIEGVPGTFRVADRGRLGSSGWIDVAVDSRAEAYELTGTRQVCVTLP